MKFLFALIMMLCIYRVCSQEFAQEFESIHEKYINHLILPGNCTADSCFGRGLCFPDDNYTQHYCVCYSNYVGSSCEAFGYNLITVGSGFISPVQVGTGNWSYYLVALSTENQTVGLTASLVELNFLSWSFSDNFGCTFVVNSFNSFWLDISEFDYIEQNGSIFTGNETLLISGDNIIGGQVAISVTRKTDEYCYYTIEAIARTCGLCNHGYCHGGTGVCVCESGYAGISCNLKLETIGLSWLIVVALCCFIIGLGTMASICRIYHQTNLPRAFTIF